MMAASVCSVGYKMGFEHTWRWFGPNDPISLDEIKQTGATGIVTALHHIPVGKIWSLEESLPVHENIKKGTNDSPDLIDNYKESIRNLAECNIRTICYNFMPVLDWSRTNLEVETQDGAITTRFETKAFAAFDLFILERPDAEKDYPPEIKHDAQIYFENMSDADKEKLTRTILFGLPGSLDTLSLTDFKNAVFEYNRLGEAKVRENLYHFIGEITPVAENSGVLMAIHPDDPPWTLLGLPRVAGTKSDIKKLLEAYDSPSNGITFCAGSLGAGYNNDLIDMLKAFAPKINFVHLRSLVRDNGGNFTESWHLEGDIDLYTIMKELLIEQNRRKDSGRKEYKIPMRPDHGKLMLFEKDKKGIYPGYSLLGRMRGLAELRGLELGIMRSLDL